MASPGAGAGSSVAPSPDELRAVPNHLRNATLTNPDPRDAKERRMAQMMIDNSSMPLAIYQVTIAGAHNFRRGFLDPIFSPLLADSPDAPSTMGDVLTRLQMVSAKLSGLQILREPPSFHLSRSSQADAATTAGDVDVAIGLRELPRFRLQSGTDVGNGEGSAYGSLLCRNMFGGAEMLTLNAKTGTRTRSAYSANLSAPVLSDPDMRISIEGLASSAEKPWASHDEVVKGAALRFSWLNAQRDSHSVEWSGSWRQITGLSATASPTVRFDAGDTVKSAIKHTFYRERRDNPHLPQAGHMLRSSWEVAGIGPLGGDLAFSKSEFEMSGALPVSLPGISGRTGISVGAGLRTGLLWPLPLGYQLGGRALPSRINDRFLLGGPTDVRGFKLAGLGPHDGRDSVGGDMFAAGSVNVLLPLPYKGPESGLRFQLFANGGRLVTLGDEDRAKGAKTASDQGLTAQAVCDGMLRAASRLVDGVPSISAGVGLVYAHPVARFELNFSLPLVLRKGEVATKGLQMGVGINFL
ncbi:outer membrane protein [Ophiocordyceps camponoti-floridani]|uniref:Outer membrane protein n=1 Tax=Ophiocordyceps camponoti-floridani TaxID=2030778 RepID=A0A8H4QDG8_9HYPO|nr:outer membrane protein [Ophiocordyceps camponoti-floridani]